MQARSRIALFALTGFLATPTAALAQYEDLEEAERRSESASRSSRDDNRFGLGIEALLSGIIVDNLVLGSFPLGGGAGATFIFDASQWRIEALVGLTFIEDAHTSFGLAGRFLWVVHSTRLSDLGVGAGVGVSHTEFDAPRGDLTLFHAEGLVQIRFFVVENVAIQASLGLGLAVGDGATVLVVGGQLNGRFGISYFF